MHETVTILGCGWLGKIVGKEMAARGISVYGSYRRPEVETELQSLNIEGFQLDFNDDLTVPDEIIEQTKYVLVFIPPSAAKELIYPQLLTELVNQFDSDSRVIFSSSTGVYPRTEGTYNEEYRIDPSLPNRLLPAERALQEKLGERLTILRLAGLIGPKRHPAYSLSGKTLSDDGSNPINLIHAFDIVSAIDLILENAYFGRTYNLVSPDHPPKKAYYNAAARHFNVAPAIYGNERATNRLINGNAIERETSFRYRHALDNFDDFLR